MKGQKVALCALLITAASYCYIIMKMRFLINTGIWEMTSPLQYKKPTLDTSGCQIPYLDPMHPSISEMIQISDPLVCKTKLPVPVVPGENCSDPSVKLLTNNLKKYGSDAKCFYSRLYRANEDITREEAPSHSIDKENVKVSDEFIKIGCVANQKLVFTHYLPFIQKKPEVEKRCQQAKIVTKSIKQLSVLLLGIDSVSRLQFLRHMKRTQDYLAKNTHYIDFMGYNKVGHNTYPNMVAMLTGHLDNELNDTTKVFANTLPLIWNEFAQSGYRTLFSEDTLTTMFNYARKGFDAQPTDYYYRPFSISFEMSSVFKSGKNGCFNERLESDVVLNWTGDLFDVFKNEPVFALTFLTRLSHDRLNDLSKQDDPCMHFIKRLKENGHLERSFVFLFGDHGFRFGRITGTYIGRMEGKLPLMYVLVPSWFPGSYPEAYANLQSNSHRLTTALDIYATLKDILHFTGRVSTTKGRSISLMSGPISENRTCEDAHIAHQYCACTKAEVVPPTSEHVLRAAYLLVDKINDITQEERDNCAELTLYKVKSATIQKVGTGEPHTENALTYYQVVFEVSPSRGLFEGSVWYWEEKETYAAEKDIERINRYDNQSICVNDAILKPFCYCVDSTS